MDEAKVKLCQSLRWLAGMVHGQTPDVPPETLSQLLLNPCGEYGELRAEVVALLTTPSLYLTAYNAIFPGEKPTRSGDSFWPLIHGLARRGVYVLENDEIAVNHSVLAQQQPFRQASHLALLDGLMTAYAASVVTVERVVKSVREISSFNPSKDLPCGVEDALLLWMNKVSECVGHRHKRRISEMLQDPDARLRRRNRLQLVNEQSPCIPPVNDICSGVVDSRCLVTLLLHYAPQVTKWSEFHVGDQVLSQSQRQHNLSKVNEFCSAHLPPLAFHIMPEAIFRFGQSNVLRTNVVAMLAHLFWYFELNGLPLKTSPVTVGHSDNFTAASAPNSKKSAGNQSLQDSLVSKRSLFRKDKPRGVVASTFQGVSLSSYSTSNLPSQRQIDAAQSTDVPPSSRHRLSSFSTSALLDSSRYRTGRTEQLDPGVTVFNAPIRNSLTAMALAKFKHERTSSTTSLGHVSNPQLKKRELITASTEGLHIREHMESTRRRGSRDSSGPLPITTALNTSDGGSWSSGGSSVELSRSTSDVPADVSGNCSESGIVTTVSPNPLGRQGYAEPSDHLHQSELAGDKPSAAACAPPHPLFSSKGPLYQVSESVDGRNGDYEIRTSITLDKYHTQASAGAAGLPIITSSDHVDGPEPESRPCRFDQDESGDNPSITRRSSKLRIKKVAPVSSVHTPDANTKPVRPVVDLNGIHEPSTVSQAGVQQPSCEIRSSSSSSTSTSGSTPTLLHLRLRPKASSINTGNNCVPHEVSELRQQFRAREAAIRKQQATLEQQLEKERQKFHQRAFFALVNHQQPPPRLAMKADLAPVVSSTTQLHTEAVSEDDACCTEQHIASNGLPSAKNGARAQTIPNPPSSSSSPPLPSPPPSLIPQPAAVGLGSPRGPPYQPPPTSQPVAQHHLSDDHTHSHSRLQQLQESDRKETGWVVYSSTGKKPSQPTVEQGSDQIEYFPFSPILPPGGIESAASAKKGDTVAPMYNPWAQPDEPALGDRCVLRHELFPAVQEMSKEDILRRREQQVRIRLEERERARKIALEQRKKEKALNNALQGQEKAEPVQPVQPVGQPAPPASESVKETIHFKLSSQHPAMGRGIPSDLPPLPPSSISHAPLFHDGPECYTRPKAKSNRKIIKNALCYVCLAGEVNLSIKQRALAELEASSASYFMILFRDTVGFKFRALYSYVPESDHITKLFGSGPKTIKRHMISRLFKYNSGSKEFKEILTKSFSLSVDALTMQNEYWIAKKNKRPPGAHR